jgi:hypothetical protein
VSLGPLGAPQVAELVGSVVGGTPGRGLTGAVGRAGGNPFYVRELTDELVREGRVRVTGGLAELAGGPGSAKVPVSLAAAIAERLAWLPGDVTEVLRWAAVLGQEFSVTDLAAVPCQSAEAAAVVADALARPGVSEGHSARLRARDSRHLPAGHRARQARPRPCQAAAWELAALPAPARVVKLALPAGVWKWQATRAGGPPVAPTVPAGPRGT